jgi:putative oxidoreductase
MEIGMNFESLTKYAPIGLALLRIVAALMFLEHGTQKFFDFPPSGAPGPHGGLPPLLMLAGAIEIVGGLLVLVGLFTRYAAFVMSGETAVIFWAFDVARSGSIFPAVNHGEDAALFCLVFLYLFLAGPGAWSIDGLRQARKA